MADCCLFSRRLSLLALVLQSGDAAAYACTSMRTPPPLGFPAAARTVALPTAAARFSVCCIARRSHQCTMSVHPDDMRRADDPSQEEVSGLRIAGGVLGFLLGPSFCRSAVLGIFIGVTMGNYLAFLEGRRGARLREAGWQVYGQVDTQKRRCQDLWGTVWATAQEKGVPEALRSTRDAMSGFAAQLGEEIAALDRVSNSSLRARAYVADQRVRLQGWAASKGITPRLMALCEASGLVALVAKARIAFASFEARVEERQGTTR